VGIALIRHEVKTRSRDAYTYLLTPGNGQAIILESVSENHESIGFDGDLQPLADSEPALGLRRAGARDGHASRTMTCS
jgi:hypothetical protein